MAASPGGPKHSISIMLQDFLKFLETHILVKGTYALEQLVKLGHNTPPVNSINDVTGGVKIKIEYGRKEVVSYG